MNQKNQEDFIKKMKKQQYTPIFIFLFSAFLFIIFINNSKNNGTINQKNYEEYNEMKLYFRKLIDDITVNENNYILNEYKKPNLYVLSKHYDHPQESTVINIYQNIDKIGVWEKVYVENESAGITGRYCCLGYMLTTYKGYYADSFSRNPRTRFTVSIKWNKNGNFECKNINNTPFST